MARIRLQFRLRTLILAMAVSGVVPWLYVEHRRSRVRQSWEYLFDAKVCQVRALLVWREIHPKFIKGMADKSEDVAAYERLNREIAALNAQERRVQLEHNISQAEVEAAIGVYMRKRERENTSTKELQNHFERWHSLIFYKVLASDDAYALREIREIEQELKARGETK